MDDVMILLVGEQPAPNLLPLHYYHPARVALVHTDRTELRARRLKKVIHSNVEEPFCVTDAYDVNQIRGALEAYINDESRKWASAQLIFNLTGGTKTMALAAYEVARNMQARAFYYQTEDNQSLVHPYHFENGNLVCEDSIPIEATLTLDDYLKLYVGDYETGKPKDSFEKLVETVLRAHLLEPEYEIMTSVKMKQLAGNVEVDLLARHGNQIAVFEIKRRADKSGIDQLNSVTTQRTLGTYTGKILISTTELESNNVDLARAYKITDVILPSAQDGKLTPEDEEVLVTSVKKVLEPRR